MLWQFSLLSTILPPQQQDWLVQPPTTPTTLVKTAVGVTLTNGLIERAFFTKGPAWCTVDLRQIPAELSFFRAITPEANLTLTAASGAKRGPPHRFDVGKCDGQPHGHFEMFDADLRLPNLTANASSFQLRNYSTAPPATLFKWAPGRHGAPTNIAWPPKGLHLAVDFVPPAGAPAEFAHVVVTVNYEMYDGLPTLRKWLSVRNGAGTGASSVVVDTLHYELLRAPNWAPEHMSVTRQQANNPTPFDQQVVPPAADQVQLGYYGQTFRKWYSDPQYDQLKDKQLHVDYTAFTFLAVGYSDSVRYGGPTGPGVVLAPGDAPFESLSVRLTLHDSTEIERMGLGVRQMLRTLSPPLNESPLLAMLNDASSSAPLRLFVDQLAATGHELAIIGFGAKGWCGMCFEQLRNATFKTWLKGEVAYAKAKGVGMSACEYF